MKRFLSVLIALILTLTVFPFCASAYEHYTSEYNKVIELGCKVFPEYVNKINGTSYLTNEYLRSSSMPTISYSETRLYDENTFVTYSEVSNGAVVLSVGEATDEIVITDSAGGSGGTTYTVTLTLVCSTYQGVFKAKDVMFTTTSQSLDIINSAGDTSSSTCYYHATIDSSYNETISTPAYLTFRVGFYRPDVAGAYQYLQFYYTFYVGGNQWWATIE